MKRLRIKRNAEESPFHFFFVHLLLTGAVQHLKILECLQHFQELVSILKINMLDW